MQQNQKQNSQKPWHRQTGGQVFLAILGGLGFVVLAFGVMVGYYFWQLKTGNTDQLAELKQSFYSGSFTADGSQNQNRKEVKEDIKNFIRPHNPTTNNNNAPITVLAFIDFECPYCQKAYPMFKEIMQEYGPAVNIVFKNFPIELVHPRSNEAALAAACAEEQNKFWPYYEQIFENNNLSRDSLLEYANNIKLQARQFTDCLDTAKYRPQIDQDLSDVASLGVRGTPTYFVNQVKIEGVVDKSIWQEVILEELQK